MVFRDREKRRVNPIKEALFSAEGCESGIYKGKERDFCLRKDRAKENLHASIRDEAVRYFEERRIGWHDGIDGGPSNHLCCSQSFCVNCWMPFNQVPEKLSLVLRELGYDVVEMLPISSDRTGIDSHSAYVAFEWIGDRNYLGEHVGGRIAGDEERTRGANFTSLDFVLRFRRTDGRVQMVAGEWKYTENYPVGRNLRFSRSGTDRIGIYREALEDSSSQIVLNGRPAEMLFFDPFDQLMRQQLLCSSMERNREMDADVVSLLHVAPMANRELLARVTSPGLQSLGSDIHDVWGKLVKQGRFIGVHAEELLRIVCQHAPDTEWASYMERRYGGMR